MIKSINVKPFELDNLLMRFFQTMDILKLSTCEPCTFEPVGSVTNVFFDDRCQQVSNLGIKEPLAHQPFYINIQFDVNTNF